MAGQLSAASTLDAMYVAATNRARRTVAAEFDLDELDVSVLPGGVQSKHRVVWRVQLVDEDLPVTHLLLAIPLTFPDELPDVYLSEEVAYRGLRIPHLDSNRQLCTFDDTAAHPNAERAGEAVIAVIQRAVKLVHDGISGTNAADYLDEFEAYWIDSTPRSPELAFADIRPEAPHRRIVSVRMATSLGLYKRLFAENEDAGVSFLEALGRTPAGSGITPALYLHLESFEKVPNITTNIDVYRLLSEDSSALTALLTFLSDSSRPSVVLFSFPVRGERVFAAWVHARYGTDIYRGKNSRRVMGQARGFRPNHLPAKVELTGVHAGLAIGRIIVHRADGARLALRTAGCEVETPGRVTIVGCGSVGGFIADTVRQFRPSLLRLVDPQNLDLHNIPRHICSMTAVGLSKSTALAMALRQHDPHLLIKADNRNVLEVLRVDAGSMLPADVTFVAVANVAVERRINYLSRQLDLGTVVYVWIEPHAIAGHAIVVPKLAAGCFECMLAPDCRVTARVLKYPEQFERADAGCRGAYLPYSGLDVQTFARAITRAVLAHEGATEGVLVTWIGDIDRARKEGWAIEGEWSDAGAFSLSTRPILARVDCPVCGRIG